MSKRNPSVLWSIGGGNQGLNGSERSNARKNIGVNFSDPSTTDAYSLEFLSNVNNSSGTADNITFTKKKVTVDGASYNASNPSTNPASSQTIKKAIETLSVSDITGFGAGKTLKTLTETDGKIAATFQDISITKSQVSDFSHAHGNITNGGALQTTDVTIASGDKLVVTDFSDSNKVARSSLAFDTTNGSNKILKKTGDWGDFIGTSATTAAAGNHSHAADFGKFTHSTQETFNNANLSISSFAETIKQSSHITRNSSTGAITLDAGIYNIEYVLEVTIPESILSNQIGQLNGVEVDYTYIHSVTVTTSTISKYTSSTVYSIDIPSAADLLSGTKIAVNQLIITYIGGIV